MGSGGGTLEILGTELGHALAVLESRLASGKTTALFSEIGYIPTASTLGAVDGAIQSVRSAAALLPPKIIDLKNAIQAGNAPQIAEKGGVLMQHIISVITDLSSLADAFQSSAPNDTELAAIAQTMPRQILDMLIVRYLEERAPTAANVLEVLGLIERGKATPPAGSSSARIAYTRRRTRPDRIPQLLQSPLGLLGDLYDWDKPGWDQPPYTKSGQLFERVYGLLPTQGLHPVLRLNGSDTPALDLHYLGFTLNADGFLAKSGFETTESFSTQRDVGAAWQWFLEGDVQMKAGIEAQVSPPFALDVTPTDIQAGANAATGIRRKPGADPAILLGKPGGSRIQAGSVEARAGVALQVVNAKLRGEPTLALELKQGKVIIDTSDASGILKPLTSGMKFESDIAIRLLWSPSTGLKIDGSAALEIAFPVNVVLGPVTVQKTYIKAMLGGGQLQTETSAALSAKIGPVTLTLERIGLETTWTFPENGKGNLGPANVKLAFKPPSGLGIYIEASVISGGGFISREAGPPERFSGALSLKLAKISIDAFGVLEKTVSGKHSFVIVIGVKFTPGIQLGYGIMLTGVGGVVGINRRVNVDAMRERLTAGSAANVLFASDPVKNAPVLLGDIGTILPPADGVFIVGPTVRLAWLELAKFDIGILIELPGPSKVVLIGSARLEFGGQAGTPALVNIRLDIFGCIDFVLKLISFDAALVNSKIFQMFELTGSAAFRLSVGDKPYLILSVGGFHPSFNPEPALLPPLQRVAVTYSSSGAISYRVRLEAYFAFTPNTLQLGAKLEATLEAGPINALGFISFDALIQFKPFYFSIQFAAGFRIRFEGFTLAGVRFAGTLSGPGPVVLSGTFTIEILFFEISWSGSISIGSKNADTLQPVGDLVPLLAPELAKAENLETTGGEDKHVFAVSKNAAKPVLTPMGHLVWRQKRAPLNLSLERFGGVKLANSQALEVTSNIASAPVKEWFSPGGFRDLSQSESLNQSPFDRLEAGVEVGFSMKQATEKKYTMQVSQLRVPQPAPLIVAYLMFPAATLVAVDQRGMSPGVPFGQPAYKVKDESWATAGASGAEWDLSQSNAHAKAKQQQGMALPYQDAKNPIDLGAI